MKIQSLLALVLLAGSMSGAELWKFAPETVKPDKNTLISPAGEGFKNQCQCQDLQLKYYYHRPRTAI